jgi:predicted transcriptional regulator
MAEKREHDWAAIELEYRAGIRSLRTIGLQFGLTDAAIIKRAKRDGWTRDLGARVKAATEEKLRASVVSEEVSKGKQVSEDALVDAYANKQTGVVRRQGERIEKLTTLADRLTDELVHQTENLERYEQLGEIMDAADDSKAQEKLKIIYNKAMSSPGRIAAFRNLVETSKTLIGLERQNVGLADNANGEADAPEKEVEMSDQEAARRIAFMLTSAMQKGQT